MIDYERLAAAVAEILRAIGKDPDEVTFRETPARAAAMYAELFGGLATDPGELLTDFFPHEHRELIMVRNIEVRSMCEHHLVPMVGIAHIGYIPNGEIVGFDRLVRVVDVLARRPQLQERLTVQIADVIEQHLRPCGVAVILELVQTCMTIRGVRQTDSRTITTAFRGDLRSNRDLRAEFRAAARL